MKRVIIDLPDDADRIYIVAQKGLQSMTTARTASTNVTIEQQTTMVSFQKVPWTRMTNCVC